VFCNGLELFAREIIFQLIIPGFVNKLDAHIIIFDFFYDAFFIYKRFRRVIQIELQLQLVTLIDGLFGGQYQPDSRPGYVFNGDEPSDFSLVMKIGAGDGDVSSEAIAPFLDHWKDMTTGAFAFQLNPFAGVFETG